MAWEKSFGLTAREILNTEGLYPLANVADKISKAIQKLSSTLDFSNGPVEIHHDITHTCLEYLTSDGVWQMRFPHFNYDIPCTTEGIYDILRGDYFITHDLIVSRVNADKQIAAKYFKEYALKNLSLPDEVKKLLR